MVCKPSGRLVCNSLHMALAKKKHANTFNKLIKRFSKPFLISIFYTQTKVCHKIQYKQCCLQPFGTAGSLNGVWNTSDV